MRKGIAFVVGLLLVVVIGLLSGCGQSVPQVSSSSSQPKGLTIRGTVYGETIDGHAAQPMAGVVLVLSGGAIQASGVKGSAATTTYVTTSDAKGEYAFTDLPSNNNAVEGYIMTVTAEGYQRQMETGLNFGGYFSSPVPDNSILTRDIILYGMPVILSISPTPGTVVTAAAQTFTVQFNEAMDPSTVRPSLTAQGSRTYAVADTQVLTTTWSADNKTLTIATGALSANKTYRLQVDPGVTAKDASGYQLENEPSSDSGGMDDVNYNQTTAALYYRTASGAAPGAPSGVLLTVNSKATIDFADANTGGNAVNLAWLSPASGAITGYRVYASTTTTGPWALLATGSGNSLASTITAVNTALYGGMYNADCLHQLAFVTDPVYFRVAAFNAEGETTSETVSLRDSVKPTVTTLTGAVDRTPATVGVPAAISATLTDFGAAGATLNLGCYVAFSEPMDPGSLTNPLKYTLSTGTVDSATVVYNSGGLTVVRLDFSGAITPGADTVTVAITGPTDMSGNVMDDAGAHNVGTIN